MVSLSVEDSRPGSGGGRMSAVPSARTITPNGDTTNNTTPDLDMDQRHEVELFSAAAEDDDAATCGSSFVELNSSKAALLKKQRLLLQQQQQQQAISPTNEQMDEISRRLQQPANLDDNSSSGEPDEEQLRRILTCKRLSEGCNRLNNCAVGRKNSLHMIGEELPPVTEGEAMPQRHMAYYLSQTIQDQNSSGSSASLRSGTRCQAMKRNSQDENTTSCSSSTSLDGGSGGPRSPGRRRSSTVSQCSSVLSEGARQQLNFDLSPDLPLDSSLMEANATSPTDLDGRPASPEPSSLSGDDVDEEEDQSFELRPMSRMSQCCTDTELMLAISPDSTLGDSNEQQQAASSATNQPTGQKQLMEAITSETSCRQLKLQLAKDTSEAAEFCTEVDSNDGKTADSVEQNLETLINDVSTVKVSNTNNPDPTPNVASNELPMVSDEFCDLNRNVDHKLNWTMSQKRAHTPFGGADLQRNKTSPNQRADGCGKLAG